MFKEKKEKRRREGGREGEKKWKEMLEKRRREGEITEEMEGDRKGEMKKGVRRNREGRT